tara:strand:- start:58 stop:747 length:690 start_codon:yes stop_codon:yes gene_type:complete
MRVLITGTNSGLGRYLSEKFIGCDKLSRDSEFPTDEFDLIIHCAFNSTHYEYVDDIDYNYINDNIFLTDRLTKLKHKKFIYISSIDVFTCLNPYSFLKKVSESIVKKNCDEYNILRCSALLGDYSKNNTFMKIYKEDTPSVFLSSDSEFNYILYSDVYDFIVKDIDTDIYNFTSSDNILLKDVSEFFNKKVSYGDFCYKTKQVDNKETIKLFSQLDKTSLDSIKEFVNE